MTAEIRPAHSPLGASGAERWMNCPGSVNLIKSFELPQSDEPDYRRHGTAAHAAIEKCLKEHLDGWEIVGETFNNTVVDAEMANAIQVFLDEVRSYITPESKVYVECMIDAPDFHPDFYGTTDVAIITGRSLVVRDYKHGIGIAVDAEGNPQIMYYAFGILRRHVGEIDTVDMGIVQPRSFHPDGPIRSWACGADIILAWAERELKPAMDRTAIDPGLDAGPWCRFCPAKLVCPMLQGLFGAAAQCDPKLVLNVTDERLGREYQYLQGVKFYIKALEEETLRRLNMGDAIPGTKLVQKKANRVFKIGAEPVFKNAFGAKAYTQPEMKSPAEMERVSPEAKQLVREWAYTPESGLTVALDSDKRPAVKVQTTAEVFAGAIASQTTGEDNE